MGSICGGKIHNHWATTSSRTLLTKCNIWLHGHSFRTEKQQPDVYVTSIPKMAAIFKSHSSLLSRCAGISIDVINDADTIQSHGFSKWGTSAFYSTFTLPDRNANEQSYIQVFSWIKVICTLRWLYTAGIWLYCDYFIWVYLALCLF